jgi:hypothetical protein
MQQNSDKVILSSGVFIITFMLIDAMLAGEYDKAPREITGGLLLILMLSSFEFIGLRRIAGPFAALIAGTVFLSRGGRIYTHLAELARTSDTNGQVEPFQGSGYLPAPEHQEG